MPDPIPTAGPNNFADDGKNLHRRAVRLRDIAELAGVHVTTVSSVLSPRATSKTRVGKKTAGRIRELARRLNYRPHLHAQIMRKRKTGLIGVIEFGRLEVHSRRTVDLVRAIRGHGYQALTTNVLWFDETTESSGTDAAIDYILSARVEGVVLVAPVSRVSPASIYAIQEAGVPCVAFNGVCLPGIPQVRSDVVGGVEALTHHLVQLGHRRVVLLSRWASEEKDAITCWTTLERIQGFKSAIEKMGGRVIDGLAELRQTPRSTALLGATLIAEPTRALHSDTQQGFDAVRKLLAAGEHPDALIGTNDRYAVGALRACFEAGVDVPRTVAVAGFAGERDARFMCPALTTVDTLDPSGAQAAFERLLQIINGKDSPAAGTVWKIPCRLVVRESCGAGRKDRAA